MICEECEKDIICDCISEQHIKPKKRSCALRQHTYPISSLSYIPSIKGMCLIHLCSQKCETTYSDKQFPKQETVQLGIYTTVLDPGETHEDAMRRLQDDL